MSITEIDQGPGRDALGAVVSYEHGNCSLAASFLNEAVYELMNDKLPKLTTMPVIESPTATLVQPVAVVGLPGLNQSDYGPRPLYLDGLNPIKLVIIEKSPAKRPLRTRLAFVPDITRRFRKKPKIELPQLAALFEDGFLLPLLSFKKTEEEGVCSWVQIGNEPKDETVHGTGDDDRSPGLALIEEVRHIMEKYPTIGIPHLETLIQDQMGKNYIQVSHLFEKRLGSKLYEHFAQNPLSSKGSVMGADVGNMTLTTNEDGEKNNFNVAYSDLTPECIMPDGSRARLSLVNSAENEIEICVITRGNVALTLATLDMKTGSLQLAGESSEISIRKVNFVQTLLQLLGPNVIPKKPSFIDKEEQLLSETWNGISSFLKSQFSRSDGDLDALKRHLAHPDIYPDSTLPVWLSGRLKDSDEVKQRKALNTHYVSILTELGAAEQLQRLRGETSPQHEYLLRRLNSLLGSHTERVIQGVIKETTIDTFKIDVEVRVELRRHAENYEVKVSTRSTTMKEKGLAPVLERIFDSTGALPEGNDAAVINDILDYLTAD